MESSVGKVFAVLTRSHLVQPLDKKMQPSKSGNVLNPLIRART